MKEAGSEKRIHVLILESESHNAMQELLRKISRILPPYVNILNYELDDTFFRVVLASLRESVALSSLRKNRGGR